MRADRLLSLLMLLQTRGRMTARQLAGELEVSERTVYRDIESLCMAGVPVYAERGVNGGCTLLDSYRTNLTGLTESEIRALFMLSIPAPLADLGVSQELKAALLKLTAALPAQQRHNEVQTRQRFYLDSVWWFQPQEALPHLQTIYQAVLQDRRLHLTYRLPFETQAEQTVEPYGLVAKTSVWYLVYRREHYFRSVRVSQVLKACPIDECFERDPGFDLAAFWTTWCAAYEQNRMSYPVTARIAPNLMPHLRHTFGCRMPIPISAPDAEGWVTLILPFETLEAARAQILSYGRAVEVLEPEALRESVIDFARQIVAFYG